MAAAGELAVREESQLNGTYVFRTERNAPFKGE
jgi:hypothetical protein